MFAAEAAAGAVEPGFLLENAYVVPLVMAASFALTLAIGKRLGKHASWIGIVSIGFCFLFAIGVNVQWYGYVHDSEHAGESHSEDEDHSEESQDEDESHAEESDEDHAEDEGALLAPAADTVGPMVDGESASPAPRRSLRSRRAAARAATPSTPSSRSPSRSPGGPTAQSSSRSACSSTAWP